MKNILKNDSLNLGDKNTSLHFLTLASKYLILVQNVLNESIKSGNKWVCHDNEDYNELTKWSDFNIFIPTLFNFYHGIEILMKGILLTENGSVKRNHNLQDLLDAVEKLDNVRHDLVSILKKYINKEDMNQYLKDFFNKNNIHPKDFFIALKYPFDRNLNKGYDYFSLKYGEEELLPLFRAIISDITKINNLAVKYAEDKGVL